MIFSAKHDAENAYVFLPIRTHSPLRLRTETDAVVFEEDHSQSVANSWIVVHRLSNTADEFDDCETRRAPSFLAFTTQNLLSLAVR